MRGAMQVPVLRNSSFTTKQTEAQRKLNHVDLSKKEALAFQIGDLSQYLSL